MQMILDLAGANSIHGRRISTLLAISALLLGQGSTSSINTNCSRDCKDAMKNTQRRQHILVMLDTVTRAIEQNPEKRSFFKRGYLYAAIGCTNTAIQDFTQAVKLDPNFAAAFTERANCFISEKDYERALFDLNRALVLDPQSGDAYYSRGRLLLLMNQPSLAISDLCLSQSDAVHFSKPLLGDVPADRSRAIDYFIGAAYEALGQPADAMRHYRASLCTN